uniref:(northern house mosquito) hypothetical protein n=1 Tax=Culex pipiens TaxID=7175 RepID=A0A8D8CGB5_CULPI
MFSSRCRVLRTSCHSAFTAGGSESSQLTSNSQSCWYRILIFTSTGANQPNGSNSLDESDIIWRLVKVNEMSGRLTLNPYTSSVGNHWMPRAFTASPCSENFIRTGADSSVRCSWRSSWLFEVHLRSSNPADERISTTCCFRHVASFVSSAPDRKSST